METSRGALRAELRCFRKESPGGYAYLMGIADKEKPVNVRLNIRGSVVNLGDVVPRGFPAVLANTKGAGAVSQGSGRLELAEAIVEPSTDGACDRQSRLDASFRPRDREHAE